MEEFIRIKYHRSLFKTEFLRFNLNAVLNLKIAKSNSKKNKKNKKLQSLPTGTIDIMLSFAW